MICLLIQTKSISGEAHMTKSEWEQRLISQDDFDPDAMDWILSGKGAALVVDEFLSPDRCQAILERVQQLGLRKVLAGKAFSSDYSGASAIDYREGATSDYLQDAVTARTHLDEIFQDTPNPLAQVLAMLEKGWHAPVGIANEGDSDYFCGVFRFLKVAPIHSDWAPRDLSNWAIGQVTRQLTWNLYLSVPESGGGVQVWNRQWNEKDEDVVPRLKNGGCDPAFFCDVPSTIITPRTGRFLIFDTRNYHAICQVQGFDPCLGYSSFFGTVGDKGPMVFWS